MNVTVAKSAGFCFGVRRAVDMVYEEAQKSDVPVYTYGPIIHNDEVVTDLQQKGVRVVHDLEELSDLPAGKIIIRSHGISRAEHDAMFASGHEVLDATCPFVHKIHKFASEYSREGYAIVIAGDRDHPEVQGILGWVEDTPAYTVSTPEDIFQLPVKDGEKVCFLAQTTFNYKKFKELVEIIMKKGYDIIVLDTICNATEERQAEARTIARHSDVMIVVGDRNSSNTRKLYEISKKECENTYYIQTSSDLDYRQIQSINNVGITAGASTPNYIIEEVSKNVRNEL
jgi:4-hydroxy-3-methylbut-2-enyl diphosphate reductase